MNENAPENKLKKAYRKIGARDELEQLQARVADLETEVQELRTYQHRLAELTDIVQELLVPLSQRDQSRVDEVLARYTDQLG
ncbi:MAG: hypothetical protein L0H93_15095 [Nocardioides sp.]|nr:hypothetical protein [Nocardioides sp.]